MRNLECGVRNEEWVGQMIRLQNSVLWRQQHEQTERRAGDRIPNAERVEPWLRVGQALTKS
jgi:hypothetical protein